jgi:hypothetical protein
MQIRLTEPEIAAAIRWYLASKLGEAKGEFTVRLHWRGRFASAKLERPQAPIPTLTEEVHG